MHLDSTGLCADHPTHPARPVATSLGFVCTAIGSTRPTALAPNRSLACRCHDPDQHQQSAFSRATNSTRTAVALSLLSGGTFAWYSALYGNPLLPEVKAESAADHGLHAPEYPWAHKGMFETFDHAA